MTDSSLRPPLDPDEDAAQSSPRPHPLRWFFLVVLAVFLAQAASFLASNPAFEWDVVAKYLTAPTVLQGILMTIVLTIVSMTIGSGIGVVVALARLNSYPVLRAVGAVYVGAFRGLPVLVQLLFWYNLAVLTRTISIGIPFGPVLAEWDTNSLITPVTAAVLGLSLNEGAYMAEIIRAGLLSVSRGQVDASQALGFSPAHTFRRIMLPQALRFIIPPTGSQVITMLKGTSLVSVIAMQDLLYSVQAIYNRTFQTIPLLLVACVWYLIMTSILQTFQSGLERWSSRGDRERAPAVVSEPA